MTRLCISLLPAIVMAILAAPCTAADLWKDAANGFSVEVPKRWVSVSPDVLTTLNHNVGRYFQQNVRYSTCFVPNGRTSAELPRILVQFQPWEFGAPTYDALEESLKNDVDPAVKQIRKDSSLPISSIEVGDARLDRKANRMALRMRTSVPGDGLVDGISFGLLGKKGVVFVHCYAKSDKFAKSVPFFELVADTVKFDAGQEYNPADATVETLSPKSRGDRSPFSSFSFTGAGRGGLIGACIGGGLGAIVMVARFVRRRVW